MSPNFARKIARSTRDVKRINNFDSGITPTYSILTSVQRFPCSVPNYLAFPPKLSSGEKDCVYFTFLHLVSYLTVNQQFGHEATESHSGQRQVMFENGQAF